jgi:23S rRNA pseudouridine1911/1915/1917 synthase
LTHARSQRPREERPREAGSGGRERIQRWLHGPGTRGERAGRPAIPDDRQDGGREVLTLDAEAAGQRLDRALALRLPEHSRTAIAAWIKEGRVRVDGRPLAAKTRMEGGETVEIDIPAPEPTHLVPQDIPLDVLHEDEAILIVNKPAGLTVHPGAGQRDGTLANALVHRLRDLPALGGSDRPGIVHRLDKDTSGVMVVARTEPAQRALSAAFAERAVEKTYLACVHGAPDDDTGVIEAAIGRSPTSRTRMMVRRDGGRAALTAWEVERRLPRHTLLRCMPRTGRTHQIRVHLKFRTLPIVGDPLYGHPGGPGDALAPRLMLHAWRLAFSHPITGEQVAFEAPLPEDFETALAALAALAPPRRKR